MLNQLCCSLCDRDLWDSLPQAFVGMPCQLLPAVQLLCSEMELSFLESGRPVPPWRNCSATLSRWMSDVFTEMEVPQGTPGLAVDPGTAGFLERCGQLTGPVDAPGAATSHPDGGVAGEGDSCSSCDTVLEHVCAAVGNATQSSSSSSNTSCSSNVKEGDRQFDPGNNCAVSSKGELQEMGFQPAAVTTVNASSHRSTAAVRIGRQSFAEPQVLDLDVGNPSRAKPKGRIMSLLTSKLAEVQKLEAAFKKWAS